MTWLSKLSLAVLTTCIIAGQAAADPCKAIPDNGPPPIWVKPGATFAGQVRLIIDGDSLCVGNSADPRTWVEVRMSDFDAPETADGDGPAAKSALSRLAAGRAVQCVIQTGRSGRVTSYDRVLASCRLPGGRGMAQGLRAAGIREGGS